MRFQRKEYHKQSDPQNSLILWWHLCVMLQDGFAGIAKGWHEWKD